VDSNKVYVTPSATNEAHAGVPADIAITPKIAAIHEVLKPTHLLIPPHP